MQTHNKSTLLEAISNHNRLAIWTKEIDNVFKFVVYVLYNFASPALLMLLYATHARETVTIARPVCGFIVVMVYFVVFYLNLVSALISHSAKKPRKLLYKFLLDNKMSLNIRLRVVVFIEKLSGPDIGFHCWNLFAMNNYTFYKYLANCGCTYFLILDLFNKTNQF